MPNVTTNELSSRPVRATHTGGCHCGAVRFEVSLEPGFKGSRCNCSICAKTAVTGAIVKPNAFRLLSGEEALGAYQWGHKISTRHFCKHCGIHCFGAGYLEQVGGDFVSVNLNALDDFDVNELELVHWDGRHDNWMGGPRSTPWPLLARSRAASRTLEHGDGRSSSREAAGGRTPRSAAERRGLAPHNRLRVTGAPEGRPQSGESFHDSARRSKAS